MAQFTIVNCKDCVYWAEAPNGSTIRNGECHFFPPTPVGLGNPNAERESEFRITHAEDWCAQAKEKK